MYRRLLVVIAACFYYSGLVPLVCWWKRRFARENSLVILNYHNASGGDLERHLRYLKRQYRLLHLEPALAELYSHPARTACKDRCPPLVLTFDDGYRDLYTYAFPLVRTWHIPITVFLIADYMERGQRFWWQEPALIAQTQARQVVLAGVCYDLSCPGARRGLARAVEAHLSHAPSVALREQFLCAAHQMLACCESSPTNERFAFNPDEALEMQASGWVSYGAHTVHHPVLSYLADDDEVIYEVSACRTALEQHLGHALSTFAYPVGKIEHIGEKAFLAVQQAGYRWALTTIEGSNTAQTNPYLLRRFVVDVDQHWLLVAAKASGVWGFFTHLCRSSLALLCCLKGWGGRGVLTRSQV